MFKECTELVPFEARVLHSSLIGCDGGGGGGETSFLFKLAIIATSFMIPWRTLFEFLPFIQSVDGGS